MDIGPFEIIVILIIIVLIVVMARITRIQRKSRDRSKVVNDKNSEGTRRNQRNYGPLVGLALILVSVILLWSGARLLKWVIWSYSWFFILLVVGILILFVSRKRG